MEFSKANEIRVAEVLFRRFDTPRKALPFKKEMAT